MAACLAVVVRVAACDAPEHTASGACPSAMHAQMLHALAGINRPARIYADPAVSTSHPNACLLDCSCPAATPARHR